MIAGVAVKMAILTFLGKFFGFARELIMAACFGTGYIMDAYVMAGSIPVILFSGILVAVGTGFIPLYADQNENFGKEKADSMFNSLLNLLVKAVFLFSVLGIIFVNPLMNVFAKGFTGERRTLAVFFLRITFVSVGFSGLNQLYNSYLNYNREFIIPILCGYCFNIFSCIFALVSSKYSEKLLALGCIFGHATTTFLLTRAAKKKGFIRTLSLKNKADPVAFKVFKLTLPVFVGEYANQVNFYIDKFLSSGMQQGSVSSLNYAYEIITLITGVTTVVITTIAFSEMNQARACGNTEKFNEILQHSFLLSITIAVPAMLGTFVFSKDIVSAIYARGSFDANSVACTSEALFWYAPYLLAFAMATPIIQIFHSYKKMYIPMVIGLISMGCNIILSILFSGIIGLGGLALATSISMVITVIAGIIVLIRKLPEIRLVRSVRSIMIPVIAGIVMIGMVYLFDNMILTKLTIGVLPKMIVLVALGSAIYLSFLKILCYNVKKVERRC